MLNESVQHAERALHCLHPPTGRRTCSCDASRNQGVQAQDRRQGQQSLRDDHRQDAHDERRFGLKLRLQGSSRTVLLRRAARGDQDLDREGDPSDEGHRRVQAGEAANRVRLGIHEVPLYHSQAEGH